MFPDNSYASDWFDLQGLIGIYYSYGEPCEIYCEVEKRFLTTENEQQAILDEAARQESREWLARHPDPHSKNDNSKNP